MAPSTHIHDIAIRAKHGEELSGVGGEACGGDRGGGPQITAYAAAVQCSGPRALATWTELPRTSEHMHCEDA